MRRLILIAHNVRSAHNVGSLLRTADGLGVDKVYLTGYSPYPKTPNDSRLPHLSQKTGRQIHKTALGAENSVKWAHSDDIQKTIAELKSAGFIMLALEQTSRSIDLNEYKPRGDLALIVGNEIEGLEKSVLNHCDEIIAIPMAGQKESFNVAVAAGMALYHLKFA